LRFWDSSALLPLLAEEPKTAAARALYLEDAEVAVWWATPGECASAIARLERDGALPAAGAAESFRRLDALWRSWIEVEPGDEVRETARRLLRAHPLRAADALQLAAAFIAAERRPPTLALVTLDERLRAAAAKEGFAAVGL
jgi:predicted nucleic acid-binding protein